MTNEQLALLLRQIAGRIHDLANQIEPLITEGEWVTKRQYIGPRITITSPASYSARILHSKTPTTSQNRKRN